MKQEFNRLHIRRIRTIGIVVLTVVFFGFVLIHEWHSRNFAQSMVDEHAIVLSKELWNFDLHGAEAYLSLACKTQNYEKFAVIDIHDKIFLEGVVKKAGGLERFLMKLQLIHGVNLESKLIHDKETIGRIEAVWNSDTIYAQFIALVIIVMIYFIFHLYLRLLMSKQGLEETVRKRTAELTNLTDSLKMEIQEHRRVRKELITSKEALVKSEKKYRSILENIEDGYYEVDIEGNLIFFNSSLCRILGYSENELMGMNDRQYLDKENARKVFKAFNLVYKTKTPYKAFDWELIRKDGSRCYVESSVSHVIDLNGRTIGFQGILRDITEHQAIKAQLQQAQKMESVGRLAGGVAHDYNNALSAIIGFTEMAMDEVDPAGPVRADLNEVLKAARHATDITRQLLAFARKQIIAPIVLDLNENLEGMLKMLRRLIGENIDLAWLPGAGLWSVKMDPSQIDQILANLCVNARDAINGVGKITISTETVVFDAAYCTDHSGFIPGEFVMLAVSDNGCGMDKEIMDKIFEPFFTTKTVDKGTGLGLATVYGIVKQNNGFVNVYSEPGKGTTIKIYLPRHEGETVEIQDKITAEIPQGRGETVLLVEDDLSILKLAEKILDGLGYTVLTAGTPGEAIGLAKEFAGKIHLLITDVIMPEMNGRELAQQLQSLYPELKRMFMSGYTADAIAHHGVLDKGVHFIQKPFSKRDLAIGVRKALDSEN